MSYKSIVTTSFNVKKRHHQHHTVFNRIRLWRQNDDRQQPRPSAFISNILQIGFCFFILIFLRNCNIIHSSHVEAPFEMRLYDWLMFSFTQSSFYCCSQANCFLKWFYGGIHKLKCTLRQIDLVNINVMRVFIFLWLLCIELWSRVCIRWTWAYELDINYCFSFCLRHKIHWLWKVITNI